METIMTVLTILITVQIITLLIVEATQECILQHNIITTIKSIIETTIKVLETAI